MPGDKIFSSNPVYACHLTGKDSLFPSIYHSSGNLPQAQMIQWWCPCDRPIYLSKTDMVSSPNETSRFLSNHFRNLGITKQSLMANDKNIWGLTSHLGIQIARPPILMPQLLCNSLIPSTLDYANSLAIKWLDLSIKSKVCICLFSISLLYLTLFQMIMSHVKFKP